MEKKFLLAQFNSVSFQQFIDDNLHDSPSRLRFKYHGKEGDVDYMLAITQIEFLQKFRGKLPEFITYGCRVPDISVAEQSTNEKVAHIHAKLLDSNDCQVIDLTAGLGIDVINIAIVNPHRKLMAIELDEFRAITLEWNLSHLHINNVNVVCDDCKNHIDEIPEGSTVFIDPARRTNEGRVYGLRDSQPDILELAPIIMRHASLLIVKCSPMLDISAAINDLNGVSDVYVISVRNDCKEVLLMISKEDSPDIKYHALNIFDDMESCFEFKLPRNKIPGAHEQRSCDIFSGNISKDGQYYLYEPDSSVMKFTPWHQLKQRFPDVRLASQSTALFISNSLYPEFPGRILQIERIIGSKDLKDLYGQKFNVVTRNYPVKTDELKKKLRVKDGGDGYIYAFRMGEINSKNIITICKKI